MDRPLAQWRVNIGLEGYQPGESGGEQLSGEQLSGEQLSGEQLSGELHAGGSSPSVLGRGGRAGAGVEGLDGKEGMDKKEVALMLSTWKSDMFVWL